MHQISTMRHKTQTSRQVRTRRNLIKMLHNRTIRRISLNTRNSNQSNQHINSLLSSMHNKTNTINHIRSLRQTLQIRSRLSTQRHNTHLLSLFSNRTLIRQTRTLPRSRLNLNMIKQINHTTLHLMQIPRQRLTRQGTRHTNNITTRVLIKRRRCTLTTHRHPFRRNIHIKQNTRSTTITSTRHLRNHKQIRMNSQSSLLPTIHIKLNTTSLTRLTPNLLSLISINRINRQTTNKRIQRHRNLLQHKRSINNLNRRVRTTRRSIINIQTLHNILNRLRQITRMVNITSSLIALMRVPRGR